MTFWIGRVQLDETVPRVENDGGPLPGTLPRGPAPGVRASSIHTSVGHPAANWLLEAITLGWLGRAYFQILCLT
jgi:hypothetical protein